MEKSVKFIFFAVGIILLNILLLTGCNTVKGFGQDMQQGGAELQKVAHQAAH